MQFKTKILDGIAIKRTLIRITHEIIEKNKGAKDVCILGVKKRGVPLARMLKENISAFEGIEVPLGVIDATKHRDDISEEVKNSCIGESIFPCDVKDKVVIIVDDVLYTGRTAKASLETVFKFGRPLSVQFVVLVDRGHRELPIRPDYVGKNVPTAKHEVVSVRFDEIDGETGVYICEK
jgi:pyrimidine operon attenuation protein/uracil phosphoribosyltransferase